jgi:hypothetical protein
VINTIPPSLDFVPEDNSSLKTFGTMLNKLWQKLSLTLAPVFTASQVYVPVVTAGAGTFTTVSAVGRYIQFGRLIFVQVVVTITNKGTATNASVTLPVQAQGSNRQMLPGVDIGVTGDALTGDIGFGGDFTKFLIRDYIGGAAYIANGAILALTGVYESA